MKSSFVNCLAMLLCMAPAAWASAADVKDSSDHPLFPNRMPGHSIGTYRTQEFAAHKFPGTPPTEVEGKFTKIKDNCIKNGTIFLEVNYATSRIGGLAGRPAAAGAGVLG